MKGAKSGEKSVLPRAPLIPAGPAGETGPHWSSWPPAHSSPRAPKPVFQASGVCRSDVLTAQVAKATNTRHMSFWLKVNEVRGSRGSPRREKHVRALVAPPRLICPRYAA